MKRAPVKVEQEAQPLQVTLESASNAETTLPHPLDHCRISVREKAAGTRFQRSDTSPIICVKLKIKHLQILGRALAAY